MKSDRKDILEHTESIAGVMQETLKENKLKYVPAAGEFKVTSQLIEKSKMEMRGLPLTATSTQRFVRSSTTHQAHTLSLSSGYCSKLQGIMLQSLVLLYILSESQALVGRPSLPNPE